MDFLEKTNSALGTVGAVGTSVPWATPGALHCCAAPTNAGTRHGLGAVLVRGSGPLSSCTCGAYGGCGGGCGRG